MKLLGYATAMVLTFFQAGLAGQDQTCRTTGQLFGMDSIGHSFLLKSDSGDVTSVHFADSTVFLQVPAGKPAMPAVAIDPNQMNAGDRLCIQSQGDNQPISKALVTRRQDIEVQQREELADWQAHSVFGSIMALDPRTRRIALKVVQAGRSSEITVDASGPVTYQSAQKGALTGLPASWNRLSVGDYIYVRGDKLPDAGTMAARLVVTGGFRTVTGTIESMDPLDERIHIRTLASGTDRTIDIDPSKLHATSPGGRISDIDFADLQEGDQVLVLGETAAESGDVQAWAVIASFSSFGFKPSDDTQLLWMVANTK